MIDSRIIIPERIPLPGKQRAIRHDFKIADGRPGTFILSFYDRETASCVIDDGRNRIPATLDIRLGTVGPEVSGLLEGLSRTISLAMQYGIPLDAVLESIEGLRFDPEGAIDSDPANQVNSITHYLSRFLKGEVNAYETDLRFFRRDRPLTRDRLTDEDNRGDYRHKFSIGGSKYTLFVHTYNSDDRAGEVGGVSILDDSDEGSIMNGLELAVSNVASTALEYRMPLAALADEWRDLCFPPSGQVLVNGRNSTLALSCLDYAAQRLYKFIK